MRIVVAIIGNKIKINGKYIHTLYSSATNPISAHLLIKYFNSMPRTDSTNGDFLYFMDNIYHGDKEDINKVVNAFYEEYNDGTIPILFDILLTDEIVDKSREHFKIIIGDINPTDHKAQIKCP